MDLFVARFLGAVLLVAAALKAFGFAASDTPAVRAYLGPHGITVALIAVELAVGLWLLVGYYAKSAHRVALVLFAVFGVFAASKGLRGEKSCECAGKFFEINPWFAFAFDLAAVLAVLWFSPQVAIQTRGRRIQPAALGFIVLSVFALSVSGMSATKLVRAVFPENIVVKGPSRVTVDHADRKRPLQVAFQLYNPTSRDIVVRSIHTGCARVRAELENRNLGPGKEGTLLIYVQSFEDFSPTFEHRIHIQTDTGGPVVWVTGTLPVSQTAYYRPQALSLEKDQAGNWPERSIVLRLPKKYASTLSGESIKLNNCLDSKVWLTEERLAADHLEYTVHFLLSPKIDRGWQGGAIEIRTTCGELAIPVSIHYTP